MAQLEIKRFPDPVLRSKGEDVKSIGDDEKRVLADMAETMYLKGGVGLAAVQVAHAFKPGIASREQRYVLERDAIAWSDGTTERRTLLSDIGRIRGGKPQVDIGRA